jgi:hypothetical protein
MPPAVHCQVSGFGAAPERTSAAASVTQAEACLRSGDGVFRKDFPKMVV